MFPSAMRFEQKPLAGRAGRYSGLDGVSCAVLTMLVVVPGYALSRFASAIDWRVLLGWPLAASLFAFWAYRSDKRRAEAGVWRISESTLQLAGLAGGWPGAYLAQRIYRHKTSKVSFQVTFWAVVLLHQVLAVDSLAGWQLTHETIRFIRTHLT